MIESRDGGQSWRYLSALSSNTELGLEGPNEADIERLSASELLAVFRTGRSSLRQVRSLDGGKTRASELRPRAHLARPPVGQQRPRKWIYKSAGIGPGPFSPGCRRLAIQPKSPTWK